jgi:multiple antibiotic resistance protein
MSEHLQAIATIFSLVNPFVCAMIFANIVRDEGRAGAVRSATVTVLSVGFVLVVAAFLGSPILNIFGISLDAFSVAGGGVLIFIGFAMLQGTMSSSALQSPDGHEAGAADLGRLVLFAASPGTITGVITIVAAHRRQGLPVTALVAIAVVLAVTWLLLILAATRAGSAKRPGIARDMASRYMGLIIIAMGIQFALKGYKAFMA